MEYILLLLMGAALIVAAIQISKGIFPRSTGITAAG